MDNAELERLKDRLDIADVYPRYARGVDRRDWALVRTCFHDDAVLSHLTHEGNVDGFIDWLKLRHANIPVCSHFIGSCLIEFVDATTAFVETYGMSFQRIAAEAKAHKAALLGDRVGDTDEVEAEQLLRYADTFEKRSGHWRIAHQTLIIDARQARIAGDGAWTPPAAGAGLRSTQDTLYRVRRELGLRD